MKQIQAKITGIGPMLMHSDRLSDPLSEATKAHKKLTSDRALKKTDEGQVAISRSEFLNSLYLDDSGRVCMPTLNIRKSLIEGARLHKGGKEVERGVLILDTTVPLEYDGPKNIEKLWEDQRFRDARSVRVGQGRIIRYRPTFKEWSLTVALLVNEEIINTSSLLHYWLDAGAMIGLGDFRPLFGRYTVEIVR
jgi:hypothetical protein